MMKKTSSKDLGQVPVSYLPLKVELNNFLLTVHCQNHLQIDHLQNHT